MPARPIPRGMLLALLVIVILVLLAVLAPPAARAGDPPALAGDPPGLAGARPALAGTPPELADLLVGEWAVTPRPGVAAESLIFRADDHYVKTERHRDGVLVETKGEYCLDPTCSPCSLDLCVGDCDQPGAEWTTTCAIIRRITDDQLELRWSPDGQRPDHFTTEEDPYTQVLTRVVREI